METSGPLRRSAVHICVQMLSSRRSNDLQWRAELGRRTVLECRGSAGPDGNDHRASQSNAVVSSKLTFSFAKPYPHEFVMAHTRAVVEWASLLLKIGANDPSRPIAVRAL